MYNLTQEEQEILQELSTPQKIQDFLDSLSFNHEKNGETCMSPRRVLHTRQAHCVEGALLAGTCLLLHKKKPIIINLRVLSSDYDHVITLYKEGGLYGALSMTNHAVLGYRDPLYKNIRELVMSYFHEYFLTTTGEKTLRAYSKPINLRRFGTSWITEEKELFHIALAIYDNKHVTIAPKLTTERLRNASPLERKLASVAKDTTTKI
ncbi:MAG: hypothetical protein RLZZ308_310 [Candidatus Parcubacteria bacterium]|jgi:hypothetical protein